MAQLVKLSRYTETSGVTRRYEILWKKIVIGRQSWIIQGNLYSSVSKTFRQTCLCSIIAQEKLNKPPVPSGYDATCIITHFLARCCWKDSFVRPRKTTCPNFFRATLSEQDSQWVSYQLGIFGIFLSISTRPRKYYSRVAAPLFNILSAWVFC